MNDTITKIYTTLFKSSLIIGFTKVWDNDYKELFLFPCIRISIWNTSGNNGLFVYINWLCFCLTLCSDPEEAANQRGEEYNVYADSYKKKSKELDYNNIRCDECKVITMDKLDSNGNRYCAVCRKVVHHSHISLYDLRIEEQREKELVNKSTAVGKSEIDPYGDCNLEMDEEPCKDYCQDCVIENCETGDEFKRFKKGDKVITDNKDCGVICSSKSKGAYCVQYDTHAEYVEEDRIKLNELKANNFEDMSGLAQW